MCECQQVPRFGVKMLDINKYLEDQKRLGLSAETKRKQKKPPKRKAPEIEKDSETESDREDVPTPRPSRSGNAKLVRHLDDGDVSLYEERIRQWRSKGGREDEAVHELNGGLKVPASVWRRLYRYQKTGVKWLWELHRIGSGGLLGDEMGLGKTVQVIAFLAGLARTRRGLRGGPGPSLVVAPASVIHQWVAHFHEWWPPLRVAVLHGSGTFVSSEDGLVRDLHAARGIVVTTYAGAVKHLASFESRKWHYVVLDEGHKIRNADTQVSRALRKIDAPHRIVITGSPLQNNLQELWSLFDFLSPGLLGSASAFAEHFASPITQGGYSNAAPFQEALALSLAKVLKDTVTPYLLRRTKADVRDHLRLPEKSEQVLFCSMSEEQKDLYRNFLLGDEVRSILDREFRRGVPTRARILVALTTLRKICNHPDLFLYEEADDSEMDESQTRRFGHWKRAGKMVVINSLLRIWKRQKHRALIFTQSRAMLCVLEQFLQRNDYKYLKMDGSTGVGARQPLIRTFNADDGYLVFLATTRVGGLGINLTGADRVIVYDPDWNPATDGQAKERAWRIGQRRDVVVYRLLSAGTVEEKIYQRQVFKQLLTNKVLLNPNQKNYLKTSTLQGLFSLEEPDKAGQTETTNIFKHTKVEPDRAESDPASSFSSEKTAAMRRLAQKISKTISGDDEKKQTPAREPDPRERYKRKLMPPPPEPEKDPVNVLDDRETDADFSTVLSELDIVNLYAKPEDLNRLETFETDIDDPETGDAVDETAPTTGCTADEVSPEVPKRKRKKRKSKKIEFLEAVKVIKEKKKKADDPESREDTDSYVLGKLFAKSGVQCALQHDKVIGLAEREEKLRLQTDAQARALDALRALKKSRISHS